MGGFVLRHDHEGLLGVGRLFELVEGNGGDDIVAMAGIALLLAVHLLEVGVVVGALAGEDFPVVEAYRVGAEMPLANHGGAVAGFLQEDGEGLLVAVKLGAIVEEPVEVRVLAGENAGTRGAADGVGAKAVFEEESVFGDAVDGRGGCDFVEHSAGVG